MKTARFLAMMVAGWAIAGCAGTSTAASDAQPSAITTAPRSDSDNPPPTLSGYVDSSYTAQTH